MRSARLPESVKRQINQVAHAMAQQSFAKFRRDITAEAIDMLAAGQPVDAVLLALDQRAASPGAALQVSGC